MKNDELIFKLLNDPNYRVASNGDIFTCMDSSGYKTENWRKVEPMVKRRYSLISYFYKKLYVHRLVFINFNGPVERSVEINHKDGNPANNDISNLEAATPSENLLHRFRVLGHPPVRGNAKINYETADAVREDFFLLGLSNSKLRAKYGLSKSTISYILNNKIWK